MRYFPQEIQRSDLHDGDHVFYYRATILGLGKGLYTHHGIYDQQEERVIHFDWRDHSCITTGKEYAPACEPCTKCQVSADGVRKSCVDCFLLGRPEILLYRCEYGQRNRDVILSAVGTCSTQLGDEAKEVVRRAREALAEGCFRGIGTSRGRWRPWNNCESFAYYCKTGKKSVGKQIKGLVAVAVVTALVA